MESKEFWQVCLGIQVILGDQESSVQTEIGLQATLDKSALWSPSRSL
jgi:hypothetical protein